jgi:hypothetical protein
MDNICGMKGVFNTLSIQKEVLKDINMTLGIFKG